MTQYRTDEGLPALAPPETSETERNRAIVAQEIRAMVTAVAGAARSPGAWRQPWLTIPKC